MWFRHTDRIQRRLEKKYIIHTAVRYSSIIYIGTVHTYRLLSHLRLQQPHL